MSRRICGAGVLSSTNAMQLVYASRSDHASVLLGVGSHGFAKDDLARYRKRLKEKQ
ncbi:MAG: hypothetical protein WCB63_01735 [Polyangiales bacterium]